VGHASSGGQGSKGDRSQHQTNSLMYGIKLGFFAGLIWGLMRWFFYLIRFTKVLPGFMVEPFFRHSFLMTGWGHVVGILSFIVFSILCTFLYILVFGRLKGPIWGILYGAIWWVILFALIGPTAGWMKPLNVIGYDTIATEFSIFVIWGLFIGYTIAFEFHDEASREPKTKGKAASSALS